MNRILLITAVIILAACGNSSKKIEAELSAQECIESVIALDDSLGSVRNYATVNQSLSLTIDEYVNALKDIDFSNCPTDFTKAFDSHIEAWKNAKIITDKYLNIRGEMHDLFTIIENDQDSTEFKQLVAEIWSTWGDVENSIKLNKKDKDKT